MSWLDKLKPHKGAAYIKGNALPDSDHETATGRALYTITAIRKAYDAGFADGVLEKGYALTVDGERIPDEIVRKAVFWYSTRDFK
jgi:hypothetical protein